MLDHDANGDIKFVCNFISVMDDNWDFLLSEFRRLGGIADNVYQKEGEYGRGIFSVNPSLRARIFTPLKLLVKKDDIHLEGNKLRIKKDKEYNQEIRDFFNFYQDNFSWGSGGKETTELFEKGLSLFNSNLKELIKKYALVDLEERHKGKWDNVIKKQFLNARGINFRNSSVIAPVWELFFLYQTHHKQLDICLLELLFHPLVFEELIQLHMVV